MIVADTSGLLAVIDGSQQDHARASAVLATYPSPILVSPFVLAELDDLLATRVGQAAELALLTEIERGAYQLEPMDASDVGVCRSLIDRYPSLGLGLADASIIVLAHRHATYDILTLDQRHFRAVSAIDGRPFRILPADAAD